ncbi:MAG: efflux RND transporter periplasmic adaptor subunit [Oceanipulchritudo sp.]
MPGWRGLSLLLIAGLTAGCGKHGEEGPVSEQLPEANVSTAPVEARTHMRQQGLPGTVYPSEQAVIAGKLMATVESVDLEIGQEVEAGEILVTLRADEVVAQVEQAEAALAQLQRNLERERGLLEQSATTVESVRTLEDEIRQARARLAEVRTMESYTRIRAPFSGVITTKEVMRGDLASPGAPMLTLEGTGNLEVHVQIPDSLITLSTGETVELEDAGTVYTATLAEWSPAANPETRTRLAKLRLPMDTPLRSGQYVRVNWPAEDVRSLWMPASALDPLGQLERVFTFENGKLQMHLIRSGLERDGELQVLAGLEPGDQVVLNPSPDLRDGQPATLQP